MTLSFQGAFHYFHFIIIFLRFTKFSRNNWKLLPLYRLSFQMNRAMPTKMCMRIRVGLIRLIQSNSSNNQINSNNYNDNPLKMARREQPSVRLPPHQKLSSTQSERSLTRSSKSFNYQLMHCLFFGKLLKWYFAIQIYPLDLLWYKNKILSLAQIWNWDY